MSRHAFYTDEGMATRGDSGRITYKVVVATENEPGYHTYSEWFATLDVARAEVERLNTLLGLSEDQARDIVLSSMFPGYRAGS